MSQSGVLNLRLLHLTRIELQICVNMPSKTRNQLAKLTKLSSSSKRVEDKPHLPDFPDSSKEEILCTYMNFLRNLPPLIETERKKIINCVKESIIIQNVKCFLSLYLMLSKRQPNFNTILRLCLIQILLTLRDILHVICHHTMQLH